MKVIFHLVARQDWEKAASSFTYAAESLGTEGFIHCSADIAQMGGVVRRLFPDRKDMLALVLEIDKLDSPVKWEVASNGEVYPHIYGPIDKSAVVRIRSLSIQDGGDVALTER